MIIFLKIIFWSIVVGIGGTIGITFLYILITYIENIQCYNYYNDYKIIKHIAFNKWKTFYLISEQHWYLDDFPYYIKQGGNYVIYFNFINFIRYSLYIFYLKHSKKKIDDIQNTAKFLSDMKIELDNFEKQTEKEITQNQINLEKLLKIDE